MVKGVIKKVKIFYNFRQKLCNRCNKSNQALESLKSQPIVHMHLNVNKL